MHGIHSRRGRGGCAEQCSPHRSPTRAVSFQISVSAREVSRGHPADDASCRLGEATALSSCARRANTQHVGAQSLVHDIHGGCARVSMVSFGRDPAPELVGVLRVGSLCGFFARVCGSSVALSRLNDFGHVRLISPLAIWRGNSAGVGTPSDCAFSAQRTRLFHGRFHGRDSTLPAIFARRPHDARRKVR